MATLKDVARKAGVSIATVSYVINNTRYVSDPLKERVNAAIGELGYCPNDIARTLQAKKSKLVGLVVSNIDTEFYAEVVDTTENILHRAGYNLLVCNSNYSAEKEQHYIKMLFSRMLCGMIIAPAPGTDFTNQQLLQSNLPVVVINRAYFDHNGPTIIIDNYGKSRECIEHMIETHGHKKIYAILRDDIAQNQKERCRGYRDAMEAAGLESRMFPSADYSGGEEALVSGWIRDGDLPESCFVTNTLTYLRLLESMRRHNLRCPEDIALIGFSDSKYNALIDPPLSAIKNPGHRIARIASRELLDILRGGNLEKRYIIVDVDIDYRRSCGCSWQEPKI